MKTTILLLFAAVPASPAETAPPITAKAAVAELSRKIERTVNPDAALTKSAGPDRETGRDYDLTKNFVIRKKESGTVEKLPFLPLPVLFKEDSTQLLDAGSEANLKQLANALKSLTAKESGARFQIEGHASKDGDEAHNLKLSKDRANEISRLLVSNFHVRASILKTEGYGETYAKAEEHAIEAELEKDRVVRVVKMN